MRALKIAGGAIAAVVAIIALLLVIGSFAYLAEFAGAPPGSTYEPAHMENGKFVPERMR